MPPIRFLRLLRELIELFFAEELEANPFSDPMILSLELLVSFEGNGCSRQFCGFKGEICSPGTCRLVCTGEFKRLLYMDCASLTSSDVI